MPQILISACLLGSPVRYDGQSKACSSPLLAAWQAADLLLPFCPELAGGLPVPRPAAEIQGAGGGDGVLCGTACVRDASGGEHTAAFIAGANAALTEARAAGLRLAVLKEGSPSCGSRRIRDGKFTGHSVPGQGVTAARLRAGGLAVFSEETLAAAEACRLALASSEPQAAAAVLGTLPRSTVKTG